MKWRCNKHVHFPNHVCVFPYLFCWSLQFVLFYYTLTTFLLHGCLLETAIPHFILLLISSFFCPRYSFFVFALTYIPKLLARIKLLGSDAPKLNVSPARSAFKTMQASFVCLGLLRAHIQLPSNPTSKFQIWSQMGFQFEFHVVAKQRVQFQNPTLKTSKWP